MPGKSHDRESHDRLTTQSDRARSKTQIATQDRTIRKLLKMAAAFLDHARRRERGSGDDGRAGARRPPPSRNAT